VADRSAAANEKVDASGVEALRHLDRIRYYEQHHSLVLDPVSVRNLELLAPILRGGRSRERPDHSHCRTRRYRHRHGRAVTAFLGGASPD